MRCEIPHRCVRRKYRIRRHSPFRLRNCWEGRSVRASSLLRQLAKGGCAARRLSWVTPGFSQSRRCKTTASAKLACLQVDSRGSLETFLTSQFIESIFLSRPEEKKEYFSSIAKKIIFEDIPAVFPVENPEILWQIVKVIAQKPGMLINYQNLGSDLGGYRARIRNHGHSCFLCEIVIRSQFHTTYEPEA